jgi:hypothetical protein
MLMKLPQVVFGKLDIFEAWYNAIRRALGTSGKGRIKVTKAPHGKRAEIVGDGRRFVRLTGSSSPYTATEVYPAASGAWTDFTGGPTFSNVYEDWGQSGLAGKVVEIRPEDNEWRFLYKRIGDGTIETPPCDVDVNVVTRGCKGIGHPVSGVDFRVYETGDPTLIDSGTTDGSGMVTLTVTVPSAPMSIDIEWDAYCGYDAGSVTVELTSCDDRFIAVQLVADADHVCACGYDDPMPRVLYFVCDSGSATLTWSSMSFTWEGTLVFTAKAVDPTDYGDIIVCECPPSPGNPLGNDTSVVNFQSSVQSISYAVTFNCTTIRVAWGAWLGQTTCDDCDWAYARPGVFPAADLFDEVGSLGLQFATVSSPSVSCGGYSASGSQTTGAYEVLELGLNNCEAYTEPTPTDCGATATNPIGSWTLSS